MPVEEAWSNMQTLLDKHMPVASGNNLIKKVVVVAIGKILPYVLAASVLSAIGYLGVTTWNRQYQDVQIEKNKSVRPANKKEAYGATIQAETLKGDSLPEDQGNSRNQNVNSNVIAHKAMLIRQATAMITNQDSAFQRTQSSIDIASKEKVPVRANKPQFKQKQSSEKDTVGLASKAVDSMALVATSTGKFLLNKTVVMKRGYNPNDNTSSDFQFGLQWSIYPAITNLRDNFNANIKQTQPYLWIIPAIWVRYSFTKGHSFMLKVNPVALSYKNEALVDTGGRSPNYFYKSLSLKVGLEYEYEIINNLRLGIGLNLNKVYSATLFQRTVATDTTNTTVFQNDYKTINKSSPYWSVIQDKTLEANFSLSYKIKNTELGANINLPINMQQNKLSPNTSVQIFVRWTLF